MFIKNKKAFTLVELIIAITILAVLATISFIKFSEYTGQARDAVIKSDFATIKEALQLYFIENGEYPQPDTKTKDNPRLSIGQYNGYIEGELGEEVAKKLTLNQAPKDPKDGSYYNYTVEQNGKSYLLRVELEDGQVLGEGEVEESCAGLAKKGKLTHSGYYTIFSNKIVPRTVWCDKEESEIDFYDFVLGGDMEPLDGSDISTIPEYAFRFPTTGEVSLVTEKNTTPNGKYSLKVFGSSDLIEPKSFTLVDSSKTYKISGKFFLENLNGNNKISSAFFGFKEYDKDKVFIHPVRVNTFSGTFTELTRDINLAEKKVYFKCDDDIFNNWRNNLVYHSSVAYDTKEDLLDLPVPMNKISLTLGVNTDKDNFKTFIERVSENECSLKTKRSFLAYSSGTKIRLHNSGNWYNYAGGSKNLNSENYRGKWVDFYGIVSGESISGLDPKKFRRGTKYVKPIFFVNYWSREEGGSWKYFNNETITYIDDIKMEVIE